MQEVLSRQMTFHDTHEILQSDAMTSSVKVDWNILFASVLVEESLHNADFWCDIKGSTCMSRDTACRARRGKEYNTVAHHGNVVHWTFVSLLTVENVTPDVHNAFFCSSVSLPLLMSSLGCFQLLRSTRKSP